MQIVCCHLWSSIAPSKFLITFSYAFSSFFAPIYSQIVPQVHICSLSWPWKIIVYPMGRGAWEGLVRNEILTTIETYSSSPRIWHDVMQVTRNFIQGVVNQHPPVHQRGWMVHWWDSLFCPKGTKIKSTCQLPWLAQEQINKSHQCTIHPGWCWFTAASVKMEALYNRKWTISLKSGRYQKRKILLTNWIPSQSFCQEIPSCITEVLWYLCLGRFLITKFGRVSSFMPYKVN